MSHAYCSHKSSCTILDTLLEADIATTRSRNSIMDKFLLDHLEAAASDDNEISDDLFKVRALIGHQGPLKPTYSNWKGCKYNVLVDWEAQEKSYEPLSVLADSR